MKDKPCPNCGHCPTCGHTPQVKFVPYPVYPTTPYLPWQSPYYYGTVSVGDTSTTTTVMN